MPSVMIVIFIIAYASIGMDPPLKVNKSATALISAGYL